jgi:hypothetical protein
MNTIINSTGIYIPKDKITSQEMEERISINFPEISF